MMEEQQYYLDQDGVAYTIVESQQVGNICHKAWVLRAYMLTESDESAQPQLL